MRLRTACDLELASPPTIKRPEGFSMPTFAELKAEMPALVAACASLFRGERGITTVRYVKA